MTKFCIWSLFGWITFIRKVSLNLYKYHQIVATSNFVPKQFSTLGSCSNLKNVKKCSALFGRSRVRGIPADVTSRWRRGILLVHMNWHRLFSAQWIEYTLHSTRTYFPSNVFKIAPDVKFVVHIESLNGKKQKSAKYVSFCGSLNALWPEYILTLWNRVMYSMHLPWISTKCVGWLSQAGRLYWLQAG